MATIKKYDTKNGTLYRVRYRKPDGSQTDKRGFRTKREAELFLADNVIKKATGDYIDPAQGKLTVEHFAQQWLNGRLKLRKPSTQNTMETAWRVHGRPKWGTRQVASIRASEIQDWVGELSRTRGAQTVRRAVFALSSALAIAVQDRIIPRNPAVGLDLPAKVSKPKRYLSHAQIDALAASCGSMGGMVHFLAYTGVRWGEAAALRVRHVNFLRKRFTVEENAVYVKGTYVFGTPKYGEPRDIPIPEFLLTVLAKQCEGKSHDGFVFGDVEPTKYPHAEYGWFAKGVKATRAADATFPRITPHDLRHSAASFAVSSNANVKAVQRMLGHSSAAMTLDIYADLFDTDLDTVAVEMDKARTQAVS